MGAKPFAVITQDVDGRFSRRYATLAGALIQFEKMSGLTVQQALDERFYDENGNGTMSAVEFLQKPRSLSAVSSFGTVVRLEIKAAE